MFVQHPISLAPAFSRWCSFHIIRGPRSMLSSMLKIFPLLLLSCLFSLARTVGSLLSGNVRRPPLFLYCISFGRYFNCGLRGHTRARCRFRGLCFRCKSPDHSAAICKVFTCSPTHQHPPSTISTSSYSFPSYPFQNSVMASLTAQYLIVIPPSNKTYDHLEFLSYCAFSKNVYSIRFN